MLGAASPHPRLSTMADKNALAAVEAFRAQYLARTSDINFDRKMWETLDIISASTTKETVSFAINIPIAYGNHLGMVHGGAIATLFDGLTSSALALLVPGLLWSGKEVSRALHCKYLKPVPIDERIDAYVSIVHADSRTATIRGELRRGRDQLLLAECTHEKANLAASPEPLSSDRAPADPGSTEYRDNADSWSQHPRDIQTPIIGHASCFMQQSLFLGKRRNALQNAVHLTEINFGCCIEYRVEQITGMHKDRRESIWLAVIRIRQLQGKGTLRNVPAASVQTP
ncbi:hypothetical protein AC579_6594 [Pseudocercospora musae]|uniref:Thioesterase domain-containing protein n=1 Tax=Pseudocercospora musae TaxID=113226 RepID=A0A139IGC5_9PEZI|nr:hypothetical protein AC579_6594 [Pseudocercospora musae]KXT13776.1 hypothetical protein AC579_6594 [Pseudocercospora musae]KXT13778.1 hypothetical protein AC579_6594 [Pseudocercospora musae]